MRIYLIRHAIAEDAAGPQAKPDEARALTPSGIGKMRRHIRALERLDVRLTKIWTSPLLRARQTADLVAEVFKPKGGVVIESALAPDGDADQLLRRLAESERPGELALVGHEPSLSELATALVSGRPSHGIEFKKGGMACFEVTPGSPRPTARLLWLLPPRILRRLAD